MKLEGPKPLSGKHDFIKKEIKTPHTHIECVCVSMSRKEEKGSNPSFFKIFKLKGKSKAS